MKDDGGSAFPAHIAEIQGVATHSGEFALGGMSLRDYFAAKAMQAEIICSCSDATPKAAEALVMASIRDGHTPEYHIALNAYKMADAMLKAREQ